MKSKKTKVILSIFMGIVGILVVFITLYYKESISNMGEPESEITVTESNQNPEKSDMSELPKVTINLTEHYITHIGDPGNFYYIDDNNVLWGSGRNEYGQLGQGTQDYEFYSEGLKIAENVVHVDYSQKGFVIFLTEDHKLYGVGNAGSGALGQYEEFDWTRYTNGEDYVVTKPILIMEDVAYASCGRDDVVCLKNDGTVWNWGTVYAMNYMSDDVYYISAPKKILEHAVLVTGGWFNHAALLQDGTVWTWGYNNAGNCGVADLSTVKEPTKVAEEVTMVWTNLAVDNYPQPKKEQFEMAWTGDIKYDTEYESIIEFGDVYPYYLNNTVIQKTDGSYWVYGENVGSEEKVVSGAEGDYTIICTYEFSPCACEDKESDSINQDENETLLNNEEIVISSIDESVKEEIHQMDVDLAWSYLKDEYFSYCDTEKISYGTDGRLLIVIGEQKMPFSSDEKLYKCESVIRLDEVNSDNYVLEHNCVYYEDNGEVYALKNAGRYSVDCYTGEIIKLI